MTEKERERERREEATETGMGEPGCRWIGRAANPGIQMGKTPLCTDAAEPVAGGATADKYVSRQHHGSVAHRAEGSLAASGVHGIPRRVPHAAPPNSSSALRACPLSLSFPQQARVFSHF